jgi:tetratricopeptide (TPR) repeat protein
VRRAILIFAFAGLAAASQPTLRELNGEAARALAAGHYSTAIAPLERAHKLAPADPNIAFDLGLAYVKTGRYAEGIKLLESILSNAGFTAKARFLIGVSYYELNQFPQAATRLEPLGSNPEYAERVLFFLEESYRKSGNLAAAEQAFSSLLRQYPNSALVHKLLGAAHEAQGNIEQALAEYKKAAQADPALPDVNFSIALLYLKQHDDAAARKWLRDELALNVCHAPALYYFGETERWADHSEAAAASYRKAIQCAPNYGEAYLALGTILQGQGKQTEALRALRRAAQLLPNKSEAHFRLAGSLAKAGFAEQSRRELQKARALSTER